MENNFYLCTRKVPVMSTIASRCTIKRRIWSLREISATFFITFVPETEDIPLKERVRRVNAHCTALGKTNVILISIHVNAAGDGSQWMNATGWSCYTCKGQTESDLLADCLYTVADRILKKKVIRTDYARDGDRDWEENFYIL